MCFLLHGFSLPARFSFGPSLLLLVASLLVSLYEIMTSTKAIEIELQDLENRTNNHMIS